MTGAKAGDVSNTKEAILSKFAPALTSDMTDAKPDQQLSKAARLLFQTTQQMIAVIGTDCSEQRKRAHFDRCCVLNERLLQLIGKQVTTPRLRGDQS